MEALSNFAMEINPQPQTEIGRNPQAQCYIIKTEKVKSGLFSSEEVFVVETLPFKHLTKRSYNDFQWLREKLFLDFPGIYVLHNHNKIPPVISKSFKGPFLQNFLNSLLERPELRNSQVLQDFLTNTDLKKIYKNIEPKGKSVYTNLEELFDSSVSDETLQNYKRIEQRQKAIVEKVSEKELETFGYALDQYISDNVPLMSKMKYLTFDISESFKKMSDSLFELNKLMSTVLKNQQKLNQTINLNDKYKVDDMILKLKSGLDGWSTWCLVNKNLVNDHFSHYLHFRKHELMALKELAIMRQTSTDQFKGAEASLESKKTKLFTGRNIEKWGTKSSDFREPIETVLNDYKVASKYIMPKETEKLESVKQLSNFINQSVYYEYVLFNRRDGRRIVKNFNKYAKKVSRATQSEDIIWNIFEKERPEDQDSNEYPGKAHPYQGPHSDVLADLDRNLE